MQPTAANDQSNITPGAPASIPTPPPQPIPPTLQAPAPRPGRRSLILKLVIILAVIVGIAVAAVFLLQRLGVVSVTPTWKAIEAPQLTQDQIKELEQKYGYDITYKPGIDPSETVNYTIKYDYNACEATTCADAFSLYSDAALTKRLDLFGFAKPDSYKDENPTRTLKISPSATTKATDKTNIDDTGAIKYDTTSAPGESGIRIMGDKRWSLAEMYFLVQRLDETGNKLPRPKVTIFTIKPDTKVLAATDLTAAVDGNGSPNFSWSAVDGAKDYYILEVIRDKKHSGKAYYEAIARTDKTSLNMSEYNKDKDRAEKAASNKELLSIDKNSTFMQNSQLFNYDITSEDSYYKEDGSNTLAGGKYNPADNGAPDISFAILAANGDAFSRLREMSGNALMAQTPLSIAFNQNIADSKSRGAGTPSFDNAPKLVFVTMADGHTARKAALFDSSKTFVDTSVATRDSARLVYQAQGTYIVGDWVVDGAKGAFSDAVLKEKIDAVNKLSIAAQPPTGAAPLAYDVKKSESNLSLDTKSTTSDTTASVTKTPTIEYPVNGTSSLVKFIAANLMAGNYTMDIGDYYTDPTVDIWNAIWEAAYQNPYVGVFSAFFDRATLSGTKLTIHLKTISKDEISKRQQDLYKQVKAVSAEIIHPGMSERDKALAINKWLVDHASYDYDALIVLQNSRKTGDYEPYYTQYPYAWNALGTAVYTKGVCLSYSEAFKAIADAAGLRSIVVTGTDNASGGAHAWNKVFMDGKWQIVDVTWNDTGKPTETTKYFGITDAQANRVQDDDFVLKRFVGDYAAN